MKSAERLLSAKAQPARAEQPRRAKRKGGAVAGAEHAAGEAEAAQVDVLEGPARVRHRCGCRGGGRTRARPGRRHPRRRAATRRRRSLGRAASSDRCTVAPRRRQRARLLKRERRRSMAAIRRASDCDESDARAARPCPSAASPTDK